MSNSFRYKYENSPFQVQARHKKTNTRIIALYCSPILSTLAIYSPLWYTRKRASVYNDN